MRAILIGRNFVARRIRRAACLYHCTSAGDLEAVRAVAHRRFKP